MQKMAVKALSGGERNRLLLARLFLEGANVLVLDEPTNDLDLVTLNVLERLLLDFEGSVLLVTHDRYFLDKVATAVLAFEGDGKATRWPGNYETYRTLKDQAEARARASMGSGSPRAGARPLTPPRGPQARLQEQRARGIGRDPGRGGAEWAGGGPSPIPDLPGGRRRRGARADLRPRPPRSSSSSAVAVWRPAAELAGSEPSPRGPLFPWSSRGEPVGQA
jgi:ATP-binding cassette subfamily F protein uup